MVSYRLDISTCPLLKIFFIKVASQHVKNKVDAFQKGLMQTVLEEFHDDKDLKQLANKMFICSLFFGLRLRLDVLETQVNDIKLDGSEAVDVCYPCATTREN